MPAVSAHFRSRYVRSPGILEPATLSPECNAVSCRRFITETPGDGRRDVACKIVPLIPLLIKRTLGPLNSNRPIYIANKLRRCCIVCQLAADWRIIINLSLLTRTAYLLSDKQNVQRRAVSDHLSQLQAFFSASLH